MPSSKLQQYTSDLLSIYLGKYTIRENIRPQWLSTIKGRPLELDFYVEELKVAIEINGMQHYRYIPFFHTSPEQFKQQVERDEAKKQLCRSYGITLYEANNEEEVRLILEAILETKSVPLTVQEAKSLIDAAILTIERRMVALPKIKRALPRNLTFQAIKKHQSLIRDWFLQFSGDLYKQEGQDFIDKIVKVLKECESYRELHKIDRVKQQEFAEQKRTQYRETRAKQKLERLLLPPKPKKRGHRQPGKIRRVNKLKIKKISPERYLVWGGESEHVLVFAEDKWVCDCQAYVKGWTQECSHIIKLYRRLSFVQSLINKFKE